MVLTEEDAAKFQIHERPSLGLRYRPEIDGLRAVAVLPVLLYHAGLSLFSGGYVGVDVFFVISGYLITKIIWSEIEVGRFSLLSFYERRIRRIIPCLLAVCLATLALGWWLFLPEDLAHLGRAVIATLGFAANLLLALQTGYFAAPAEMKPLLHTWSLAVEEQYYLVFPLFLMLAHRFALRQTIPILGLISAGSLALAVVGVFVYPTLTFYLAPTRAWELCAGSLLALGALPAARNSLLREWMAALGLGLIAVAVFLYTKNTPFPGAAALPPVIGALLIIYCGEDTWTGRLLSHPVPVFVGLISYSLYLWHWPLIVFARYRLQHDLAPTEAAAVILASIAMAIVSWRLVEQPFRSKSRIGRKALFTTAGTGTAAVAAFSLLFWIGQGVPDRFSPTVNRFANGAEDFSPTRNRCHRDDHEGPPLTNSCVYGANVPPDFAIWGDSHGVEIAYALGEVAQRHRASLLHLTYSSCPPAVGYSPRARTGCRAFNDRVFNMLVRSPRPHTVLLAGCWDCGGLSQDLERSLRRTIRGLLDAGKTVVLIGPTPMHDFQVPTALATYAASHEGATRPGEATAAFLQRNRRLFALFAGFDGPNIVRVYPHQVLCKQTCLLASNGRPLYFDSHHPSMTAARMIAPLFDRVFSQAAPRPEHRARPGTSG